MFFMKCRPGRIATIFGKVCISFGLISGAPENRKAYADYVSELFTLINITNRPLLL